MCSAYRIEAAVLARFSGRILLLHVQGKIDEFLVQTAAEREIEDCQQQTPGSLDISTFLKDSEIIAFV